MPSSGRLNGRLVPAGAVVVSAIPAAGLSTTRIAGGKRETRVGAPYSGGELDQLARAFDEKKTAADIHVPSSHD